MNTNDGTTEVVRLELQRQLRCSGFSPRGSGTAGGEPETIGSGGNAVIIPFPETAVETRGFHERTDPQRDSGQHWGGSGTAVDDGSRWHKGDDAIGTAPGLLDRVSTGVGVALLAIQVRDFPSLKVLFGDRVAASAVDLFELRLREIFRNGDEVVRASSVEFHVLLKSCNDWSVAAEAAQRVLDQCAGVYSLYGVGISLSSNIGIALQTGDKNGFEELVRSACVALRESEEQGENTYRFYTDEIIKRLRQRADIASEVGGAREEGRLVLHYQPQYDLKQRRLVGFEALLRLRTRAGELWGPDRFIEFAEKSGAIVTIGRWVLEEACRQLKLWQAKSQPGLVMAVNVSPRQLADERFPDMVEQVLAETGLDPEDIELEIAERQMVGADPIARNTLARLHERNLRLAVDDFGTGYSSFAYLTSLPISTVKLDRGFLAGVPGNDRGQRLVRGLVKLLGELGLRFLAEGVETEEQERFLLEVGCPCAQGFGLGVPLSAADSEGLFSAD